MNAFCSPELSALARQKGFNARVNAIYQVGLLSTELRVFATPESYTHQRHVPAPTPLQLARWLTEQHRIAIVLQGGSGEEAIEAFLTAVLNQLPDA